MIGKSGFSKKMMKSNGASRVAMVCVILMPFLLGACASQSEKQTSSVANESIKSSAKVESEADNTGSDQDMECRWIKPTGSTLRQKVCKTKTAWEKVDNALKRHADRYMDEIIDEDIQTRTSDPGNGLAPF